jgi:hypothetical protein
MLASAFITFLTIVFVLAYIFDSLTEESTPMSNRLTAALYTRIDPTLKEQLEEIALRHQRSVRWVLEKIISDALAKKNPQQDPFADLEFVSK